MPKQLLPDVIGHTPLLYLREVSELTGCDIYGKAEFMNPGFKNGEDVLHG